MFEPTLGSMVRFCKAFPPLVEDVTSLLLQYGRVVASEACLASASAGTVEFRRLGQCFLDWATAVVGKADRELTCVTLTYHSSGPIYETLAQSTEFHGM